jgi:lipopolysaccharide kinase (Kdo/WaaP) family protein
VGTRTRLGPGIPDFATLGASEANDLLDPPRLQTGARARILRESPHETLWRVPLPGTPDEQGRLLEPPTDVSPGWLWVRVFRGRNGALLEARCTHPRSTSVAARWWNLACHLEASGVGGPRLVALVERGNALAAAQSCLVVRELEGFAPLGTWLAAAHTPQTRRRGLASAGRLLARLLRSGAWLPELALDDLWIEARAEEAAREGDCDALDPATFVGRLRTLQSTREALRAGGLRVRRLPAVACVRFARGRVFHRISSARARDFLDRLASEARARQLASERELLRVCLRAVGREAHWIQAGASGR